MQAAPHHVVAVLIEAVRGCTHNASLAVAYEFGVDVPAIAGKKRLEGGIVLALNGGSHLLEHRLIVRTGGNGGRSLDNGGGIGGERLARLCRRGCRGGLVAEADVGVGIAHRRAAHHGQHRLNLSVHACLAAIFKLVFQLQLRGGIAGQQLKHAAPVLRAVDIAPAMSVEISIVYAVDRATFIRNIDFHVVAFLARHPRRELVEDIVHLLWYPVDEQVALPLFVGIVHFVGILHRLQERERPVELAQGIVHLAFLLRFERHVHKVLDFADARGKNLLDFRAQNPARHVRVGFVAQDFALCVGQRGLGVSVDGRFELRGLVHLVVVLHKAVVRLRVLVHVNGNLSDKCADSLLVSLINGVAPTFSIEVFAVALHLFPRLGAKGQREQEGEYEEYVLFHDCV